MIEDLKRILIVVEEGNITRAAEKLYLTQPALSHAIKRVERQLDIQIFRQNGKKLQLTNNGKASLIVFERIVTLWEGLIEKRKILEKETCTIGVYDNASLLLSPFFKKHYSRNSVALEIIIDNSEKLFSQLLYGVLDICVCVADLEKSIPNYVSEVGSYIEKLIPVSSFHWKQSLDTIPFVLYNRESLTRKYIEKTFVTHAIQPKVIAESTSPTFMKELAIVGSGVALLPENFVKNDIEQGLLQKLDLPIQFTRPIGIYINSMSSSISVGKFIEEIKFLLGE